MSKNCLVTKYKGVVDNNDLERLNEIGITFIDIDEQVQVNIWCIGSSKVYTSDGSNAVSSGAYTSNWGDEAVASENDYAVCVLASNGLKVSVVDFYDVIRFGFTSRRSLTELHVEFDVTKLKFMSLIDIYSNINVVLPTDITTELLSKISSLNAIRMISKQIVGDFKYLGHLTSLTRVQVANTNIRGKIEEFVALARSEGRTTCSEGIALPWVTGNLTLGGNAIPISQTGDNAKLYWDATTITYDSGRQGVDPIVVTA